jgi:hypothetical protein
MALSLARQGECRSTPRRALAQWFEPYKGPKVRRDRRSRRESAKPLSSKASQLLAALLYAEFYFRYEAKGLSGGEGTNPSSSPSASRLRLGAASRDEKLEKRAPCHSCEAAAGWFELLFRPPPHLAVADWALPRTASQHEYITQKNKHGGTRPWSLAFAEAPSRASPSCCPRFPCRLMRSRARRP